MELKYCVYSHTNKINGKKYIGITSQLPHRRWNEGKGYMNNAYFYRAIQKYGWQNFYHSVLYSGLSKSDAEDKEIELIAAYKTNMNKYGYNIESGGNSTEKFTPEIKRKISEALKGHTCSEETRKKISAANKGRKSNRHIKMTAEQKERLRLANLGKTPWNKGRPWTNEERAKCNGKAVKCLETGAVYRTAHEAGKILGIDFSSICSCCRGKLKRAGKLHWQYAETGR